MKKLNRPTSAVNTKIIALLHAMKPDIPKMSVQKIRERVQESFTDFKVTDNVVRRILGELQGIDKEGFTPFGSSPRPDVAERNHTISEMKKQLASLVKRVDDLESIVIAR